MVNQRTSRLSAAKLHRHQRVQKMLAHRREAALSLSDTSSSDSTTHSDDDHSTSSLASEVFVSKQQLRKLRNRKSAESSRQKKKQDADKFKTRVAYLEHENAILRSLLLQKHPDLAHLMDPQILQSYFQQGQTVSPCTNQFPPQTCPAISVPPKSAPPVPTLPSSAVHVQSFNATAGAAAACNSNEFAIQP